MDKQQESQAQFHENNLSRDEAEKILNTVKATRDERDQAMRKSRELEQQLTEVRSQLEKLEPFQDLDLERYREFLEAEEMFADKQGEIVQRYQQDRLDWESQINARDQLLQLKQQEMEQQAIAYAVEKAFFNAGGKRGRSELGATYFDNVRRYAQDRVQLINGKPTVVDENGNPDRDRQSIEALMEKFASDFVLGMNFEPQRSGHGGGKPASNSNSTTHTKRQLQGLHGMDRVSRARDLNLPLG